MKVIVKEKNKKDEKVPFEGIPVGYVYIGGYRNGPILLKLENEEAAILAYGNNIDWFHLAIGWRGMPAYKILGKLTEITVTVEE